MDRSIGNNSYSVILSNHNTITGNCGDDSKKGSIDSSRASASRKNYNNPHHHHHSIESNIAVGDFCALAFEKPPSKIPAKQQQTELSDCAALALPSADRQHSPTVQSEHAELLLDVAESIAPPSALALAVESNFSDGSSRFFAGAGDDALLPSSTRQPQHHHVSETFAVEDDEQFIVQTSVKQEKNV